MTTLCAIWTQDEVKAVHPVYNAQGSEQKLWCLTGLASFDNLCCNILKSVASNNWYNIASRGRNYIEPKLWLKPHQAIFKNTTLSAQLRESESWKSCRGCWLPPLLVRIEGIRKTRANKRWIRALSSLSNPKPPVIGCTNLTICLLTVICVQKLNFNTVAMQLVMTLRPQTKRFTHAVKSSMNLCFLWSSKVWSICTSNCQKFVGSSALIFLAIKNSVHVSSVEVQVVHNSFQHIHLWSVHFTFMDALELLHWPL